MTLYDTNIYIGILRYIGIFPSYDTHIIPHSKMERPWGRNIWNITFLMAPWATLFFRGANKLSYPRGHLCLASLYFRFYFSYPNLGGWCGCSPGILNTFLQKAFWMIPMDYVAMFQYGSHMTVGGSVSKYRVWLKKWISIDNSNC